MKNRCIFSLAFFVFSFFGNECINIEVNIDYVTQQPSRTNAIIAALCLNTSASIDWLLQQPDALACIKRFLHRYPGCEQWIIAIQKEAYFNGNMALERLLHTATLYVIGSPGQGSGFIGPRW